MGLFDGLKRDKKAAETVKQHKKEEIVEDELIIDHIEVVDCEAFGRERSSSYSYQDDQR